MNDLLEFTGAMLYFTVSIILCPLFLFLEFMLWSVVAARKINSQMAKWKLVIRRRSVGYQLRHLFAFVWRHQ